MKMKNILFTGLLGLCVFTGCDYLDFDESVGYEKEDIFSVFVRAKSIDRKSTRLNSSHSV